MAVSSEKNRAGKTGNTAADNRDAVAQSVAASVTCKFAAVSGVRKFHCIQGIPVAHPDTAAASIEATVVNSPAGQAPSPPINSELRY